MNRNILRGATTAVLIVFSLVSRAELPQNEFACHVQTVNEVSGLILVQADRKEDAVAVAASAVAWEVGGGKSQSTRVFQCIQSPGGVFDDREFDQFYKGMPK